jgi:hypothetical protein
MYSKDELEVMRGEGVLGTFSPGRRRVRSVSGVGFDPFGIKFRRDAEAIANAAEEGDAATAVRANIASILTQGKKAPKFEISERVVEILVKRGRKGNRKAKEAAAEIISQQTGLATASAGDDDEGIVVKAVKVPFTGLKYAGKGAWWLTKEVGKGTGKGIASLFSGDDMNGACGLADQLGEEKKLDLSAPAEAPAPAYLPRPAPKEILAPPKATREGLGTGGGKAGGGGKFIRYTMKF